MRAFLRFTYPPETAIRTHSMLGAPLTCAVSTIWFISPLSTLPKCWSGPQLARPQGFSAQAWSPRVVTLRGSGLSSFGSGSKTVSGSTSSLALPHAKQCRASLKVFFPSSAISKVRWQVASTRGLPRLQPCPASTRDAQPPGVRSALEVTYLADHLVSYGLHSWGFFAALALTRIRPRYARHCFVLQGLSLSVARLARHQPTLSRRSTIPS